MKENNKVRLSPRSELRIIVLTACVVVLFLAIPSLFANAPFPPSPRTVIRTTPRDDITTPRREQQSSRQSPIRIRDDDEKPVSTRTEKTASSVRNDTTTTTTTTTRPSWYVADTGTTKNIGQHESCFVMARNGRAYLIGGRLPNRPVCEYDPRGDRTWDCHSRGAVPYYRKLHHASCVAVGWDVYLVAAWTGEFPREETVPDTLVYHPLTDTWSRRTGLPSSRNRGAAAAAYHAASHSIYVSHGNDGGHFAHSRSLALLDRYDVAADSWHALSDGIVPRDHAAAGIVRDDDSDDDLFCVAAGRNGRATEDVVLETECYRIGADAWELRAPVAVGRGGVAYGTTCDGRQLLVVGGESARSTAHDDVAVFDGRVWRTLPSLVRGRHGTGVAVDCDRNEYYVAGGSPRRGGPRDNGGLQITEHYGIPPSPRSVRSAEKASP